MDYQFVSEMAKKRPSVREDYQFNEDVRIGRGSYGQVYKAVEKRSRNYRKYYALKEVELTSYSPSTCREIAVRNFIFDFFERKRKKNNQFSSLARLYAICVWTCRF